MQFENKYGINPETAKTKTEEEFIREFKNAAHIFPLEQTLNDEGELVVKEGAEEKRTEQLKKVYKDLNSKKADPTPMPTIEGSLIAPENPVTEAGAPPAKQRRPGSRILPNDPNINKG